MAQPAMLLPAMLGHQALSAKSSPTDRHILTHAPTTAPDPEDTENRRLPDPDQQNTGTKAGRTPSSRTPDL